MIPLLAVATVLTDDFERGRPSPGWAIAQQKHGSVSVVRAPGRAGKALQATADAKQGSVSKADLVARTAPMAPGTIVEIAFDLYAPAATPLNSIQLVDIECATCGEGGNPGVRLYLRRGRLRIDRSKIGIAQAWTRDDAPALRNGRWHHIELAVHIGAGDDGRARVRLDGVEVLSARGATVLRSPGAHADRVQIGVTANSNPVPVTLFFDAISIRTSP